ncbi:hypothetical protein BXY66_0060 [Shimia isoporae]|uniref:Sulfotransferase family protein n=1 Tax=Shimia isoporae TaxID=647720 RepID=A0A4R1NK87_9RHOB|nr:hypothetical protein [Shimia isoporae]TCL08029.1 hypothetical protein BXY66_0060 [Shimia isoporae]
MASKTRPLIIHAGFHKTGTTTLQRTLRENRDALKRHCNIHFKWKIRPLVHATCGYSTWRDPLTLGKVSVRADEYWAAQPTFKSRALILSAEQLAGHLPGRPDVPDYRTAVPILSEIVASARRRFEKTDQEADIRIVMTTRQPDAWIESAYWEHVKSSGITMDVDQFRTQVGPVADQRPVLEELAESIAPAPVIPLALEHWQSLPLGLAAPLLDLAEVPPKVRDSLTPATPQNTRLPQPLLDELLDLNRKISDREARNAAKDALMAAHERSQRGE